MGRTYGSYFRRVITGLFLACGTWAASSDAQAGFEWVPAPQQEPAPPAQEAPAPQPQPYGYGAPPQQQPAPPYANNDYYQPPAYPQTYGNVGYVAPPPVPSFSQMPVNQMPVNQAPMNNGAMPQYGAPYAAAPAPQGLNFPNPIPPMMPPMHQQQAAASPPSYGGQEVMIKRGFEEPINAQAVMQAASAGNDGLRINPYPLRNGGTAGAKSNSNRVESAMMEESRAVNPLPLGYGFSTGAKPRRLAPTAPGEMPQQQLAALPMQDAGMTPMPGGPVAPLPGYAAAPVQREEMMAPPSYQPSPSGYPMPSALQKAAPYQPQPDPWQQPAMEQQPAPQGMAASAPGTNYGFGEAVGFGRDLPLALALSQVIPPDHALFFETAVNAESNVSWQGGKPWNEVLQDMLAPLGLRAEIQPNLVMIRGA